MRGVGVNVAGALISAALIALAGILWNSTLSVLWDASPIAFIILCLIASGVGLMLGVVLGNVVRKVAERSEDERVMRAAELLLPGEKQLLCEMEGGDCARVGSDEVRRSFAADRLLEVGLITCVDCDRDGSFYQIEPKAREVLRMRAARWERAKAADGVPNPGLLDRARDLEWHEPTMNQKAIAEKLRREMRA